MANMREIRNRIKSIESTRQITRSMRMVAASKLGKTQAASQSLEGFAAAGRAVLQKLGPRLMHSEAPLLQTREEHKRVFVLFVGNRGLCGTYNSSLLKYLEEQSAACPCEQSLVVVGRWGRDQIKALGLPVLRRFDTLSDTPTAAEADEITDYLKELYLSGEADRVVLVYQHFRSVLQQVPNQLTLLPLSPETGDEGEGGADLIFEPDAETLLARLSELVLRNSLYSVLLEAKTGEHASRMTAMTAASDNTDELIQELSLKLNHARQAAITTEISEIVGGAAAL